MKIDHENLTATFERGAWVIELQFREIDYRLECVGLAMLPADPSKPRPLQTKNVRPLKLASLIDEARSGLMASGSRVQLNRDAARAEVEKRLGEMSVRKPFDHWVQVADIYMRGLEKGAPTRAVAKELRVSYSRAAKYVTRARQLGLLTATEKGKASRVVHHAPPAIGRIHVRATATGHAVEGSETKRKQPPRRRRPRKGGGDRAKKG